MHRNKKLQEFANKSLLPLKDDAVLDELKGHTVQTSSNKRLSKKTIFAMVSSMCAVVLTIVLLCVFLVEPKIPTDQTGDSKFYAIENQRTVASSIDEVNNATEHFAIKDLSDIMINKVVDYHYNETLYFVIAFNNDETMESLTLFVVVNDDYTLPFPIVGTIINETIADYSVSYTERYTEDDGLFFVDTTGEIFIENGRVFVEYSGVDFEKRNNFLTYLSRIIC